MAFYNGFVRRFIKLWAITGEVGAKSRLKQFLEMIWLAGTCEFSPGEYWVYGFHMKDKDRISISKYLPSKIYFSDALPKINNLKTTVFLENKWIFYLHFSQQKISTPLCYGIFHSISGFSKSGRKLCNGDDIIDLVCQEELSSFVVKPIAGTNGRDVFKITVVSDEDIPVFLLQGKEMDASSLSQFLASITAKTNNCGFLVQECVYQHKVLSDLSPSACMNIRIITVRKPSGVVLVASASARVGRLGSIVSNAGSGGMIAKVDEETGVIVKCRSSIYIGSVDIKNHPDTGTEILNARIPFWGEAVDLCLKAAELIPEVNSVGWDVLITDQGPILLEGNHDWDVIGEQIFGKGFLTEENTLALEEHGFKFNHFKSSGFRLGKVFQFVS